MTVAVKGKNSVRITPLIALAAQVVALDAAMLVAVTGAEVGAVHKLRTSTRRVEAQMRLLEMLSTGAKPIRLPDYAAEAKAVRRRLMKVRRAAGVVRDLDVQTTIIRMDAPSKSAVHRDSPGDIMRRQAKKLRKYLEDERDREAVKLQIVLHAQVEKLAADLQALEHALKSPREVTATEASLSARLQGWFAEQTTALIRQKKMKGPSAEANEQYSVAMLDEDELHTVRKAAKLCRYVAESAPEGSATHALAVRFESMQEAGGRWHDWLLLEQLSRHFHGKDAELTVRYGKHRDAALEDYRLRLSELMPTAA
ncbi:CHAD domain-containing protein [Terriglobus roseus]|nr:CHAD domain-containing protein [Terriglobus roseus]